MAISKRKFNVPALYGGMNYTTDTLSIRKDQAYRIINCHLDSNGRAYSRHGSRKLNIAALPAAITSIYDYRRPEGGSTSSILLVTAGKYLYRWNPLTEAFDTVTALSSAEPPEWVTFTDGSASSWAFMANGTDFIRYNGVDVEQAASTYPWLRNPRYIKVFDNRMLAAGCDSDPYRVWVSNIADGTDWYGGESTTPQYWTIKAATGDRVTALEQGYNYMLIFSKFGVEYLNEADPDSDSSVQVQVSRQHGTSSHRSVVSVGSVVYFADESHIYKATLRAAVENGLQVEIIDDNIRELYSTISDTDNIIGAYDPRNDEIQWAIQSRPFGTRDKVLVYSLKRSGLPNAVGSLEDVWSGVFEGDNYEPYTLAPVVASDGRVYIYRGDTSGYVYVMDEDDQYKDDETDISVTIVTAPLAPYDISVNKRARDFYPKLYQKYNEAVTIQWIIDGRYILPSSAEAYVLRNDIPYWDATTWDGSVWNDQPVMPTAVTLDTPFNYLQFIIYMAGTNDRDEMAYSGGELWYQPHTAIRVTG